eukprot:34197_1
MNKFRFVIIMEYIAGGDLSKYIKNILNKEMNDIHIDKQEEFANFMVCRLLDDMTLSLIKLYEYKNLGYLHNDIKPGNIFINLSKMKFKLADYGHMMPLSYILNKTNVINALGTPNYIGLSMGDLMLNLFDDEELYNKAKYMYLKYPNHADLYQLLASVISLYNTICDSNLINNTICEIINNKTLYLDINAEDKNSSFMTRTEPQDEHELLYVVNKERYYRIKDIMEYNGNKLFQLILKYIIGLTNDYLVYRKNETDTINEYDKNNDTYSLEIFRNDIKTVCDAYMIADDEKQYVFNYQIWKYDKNMSRGVLYKFVNEIDFNQLGEENNGDFCSDVINDDTVIIYDSEKGNIIFPKKDKLNDIHHELTKTAVAFNEFYL